MERDDKFDAVDGLRKAFGQHDVLSLRTLNPEGKYVDERIAFEKNDEETKQKIIAEQKAAGIANERYKTEKTEEKRAEDTFRRLYEQHKDGAARSSRFGGKKG